MALIHLDLLYWKPGWSNPTAEEWKEKQREALAGDAWIADGNYPETLPFRLERADTIVVLDTPWWRCAAHRVGARDTTAGGRRDAQRSRRFSGTTPGRRVARRAEVCRNRHVEAAHVIAMASQHGSHARLYVLRSKQEASDLLSRIGERE